MSLAGLPPTIPHAAARAAALWGDAPALLERGETWSFNQLWAKCREAASALLARGVGEGDRIAIWAPNSREWIIAAVAAMTCGAAIIPLNTRLKGREAGDILRRTNARLMFTVRDFLGIDYPALLAAEDLPALAETVLLDDGFDAFLARGQGASDAAIDAALSRLTADHLSDILFTSGTTGIPKGVMMTYGRVIPQCGVWIGNTGLKAGERYLIVNPFFHTFGYKAGWVAAFLRGATVYPEQVFDPGRLLARIDEDRISFLPGPPAIFQGMLAHPQRERFDLSSLRSSVTGASTVPPVLIRRMREDLGIRNVTTAYGLTECGGCATVCEPSDSVETVAGTCGHAIPGTELRCVDLQGRDVPVGEPGEVLLRGYHVMKGYFEDEQGTRDAIDDGGWLHTGDIGVLDARGYLRITDRLKDMFIAGGFNCYPAEIERVLSDHPDIGQVAVVGVPDARLGEVGCACVIPHPGIAFDALALIAWSRERMANYKVPRHVLVFEAFPLTVSAKVLKRELAAVAAARLGLAE